MRHARSSRIGSRCATTIRKLPLTRPSTMTNAICAPAGSEPNAMPRLCAKRASGPAKEGSDTDVSMVGMIECANSAAMLLHHVAELDDGKIHLDHKPADESAQHDDHERLAQAREPRDLFVYLAIA